MRTLRTARRELDLLAPVLMGIVNATPDSFSDGPGERGAPDALVARAAALVAAGW